MGSPNCLDMRLLTTLNTAIWAIHPMTAESYLPVVANMLKGNFVENGQQPERLSMTSYETRSRAVGGDKGSDVRKCAVYTVEGAITKADQWCGPEGTVSLMRSMRRNDKDPSVVGHLLDFDSGGGEGTNIVEVANMIRSEVTKPVVAHFNGLMCSAAYGIGCAADEIYATLKTDIVGSVGVLMTLADWKAYFEEQGLKIHEVYATQSSEKNQPFLEVHKGNYELLRQEFLDPFAASFIDMVQSMRPQTKANADIFKGKTYMAQDAAQNGLIDGIADFNSAVNRVFALADEREAKNPQSSSSKKTDMKFGKFNLSFTENGDGSTTMTADQWATFEAAVAQSEDTIAQMTQMNARLQSLETKVDGAVTKVEAVSEKVDKLDAWAEATPAALVAKPNPKPEEGKVGSQADNAVKAANRMIAQSLRR